jgi:hypothetical protein
MSLREFERKGWIRPHTTSRQEIQDLLSIVTRDLQDAEVKELSADWRFGIAYNAALKLCTILLYRGIVPDQVATICGLFPRYPTLVA